LKILFGLTYYSPHVSGLTFTVQRLAEGLAERGHQVTIITSGFNKELPAEEMAGKIRIVRVPVAFTISKGPIMPSYLSILTKLAREHDAGILNLPCTPFESVMFPAIFRLVSRLAIGIVHCDLRLPAGRFNRLVDAVVFTCGLFAGSLLDKMVTYTLDYARNSPLLRLFPTKRLGIAPPVVIPTPDPAKVEEFRKRHVSDGQILIGFPCRFATEKGVEVLLSAYPSICRQLGRVKVVFAGEYRNVIGEEDYIARLMPEITKLGSDRWEFLGVLSPEEMANFFAACDVTVLPSLNRTESFGLVQVESMLCGTPVIASNLPGVRIPVKSTGMGRIVPPGDAEALAQAVVEVVSNEKLFLRSRAEIETLFSLGKSVTEYESLLSSLL